MKKLVARWFLRWTGWEPEGARPLERRYVLIAAPHTSNWDLPYLVAFAWLFEVRITFMAKHVLFRPPLGWLMRRLGGVPVVRHERRSMVQQMADLFERQPDLALVVPAEGTRRYVPHWKSGFYHIAREADVPIVLGYLDYARKRGGFGPAFLPSGEIRRDMDEIRDFYADKQGKYPDQFGEARLKEEM